MEKKKFNVYRFDAASCDYTGCCMVVAENVAQALTLFKCIHANIPYGYGRYLWRGIEVRHPELTWLVALDVGCGDVPSVISDTIKRI